MTGRPLLILVLGWALCPPVAGQAVPRQGCDLCHGELELLRQHTATLEEAMALLAPATTLLASAHRGMSCAECHSGFDRFPHREGGFGTRTCRSCHEAAEETWASGAHATESEAGCTACHGVHAVASLERLRAADAIPERNAVCATCHLEAPSGTGDAHADRVLCTSCHNPHATLPVADPGSWMHARRQASTCGACHDETSLEWTDDAHAAAVSGQQGIEIVDGHIRTPSCAGCHGAHPILPKAAPDFATHVTERCQACHEDYSESFADSYHGKAATLGSDQVAQCAGCHGAHSVYPARDARSSVSEDNLLETCRSCHPEAGAKFAGFRPHAHPNDPNELPQIYWTNRFMIWLLMGVFGLFGLHSILWVGRSAAQVIGRADADHDAKRGSVS